jgi:hypothetical protein
MLGIEMAEGDQVVFVYRRQQSATMVDSQRLMFRTAVVGDPDGIVDVPEGSYQGDRTIFYRSTKVRLFSCSQHYLNPTCIATFGSDLLLCEGNDGLISRVTVAGGDGHTARH